MKRLIFTTVALSLALLLIAALPAAASASNSFRGDWKGIDVDGSTLSLSFIQQSRSGGKVFDINGFDDDCSGCGGGPAQMNGLGVLDGENSMSSSTVWFSVPNGDTIFYFNPGTFTYDPDADTVTDPEGIVYHRAP